MIEHLETALVEEIVEVFRMHSEDCSVYFVDFATTLDREIGPLANLK
jgi:hypothetical protein